MVLAIPLCFATEVPPGADRERIISGTPEILAVKRMLPLARAEIGRPEGAWIMERVSRMST